ncbi:hypothetical protein [Actinomyces wuliandei]|uniref:hypothetical protein n=1 Tax=Actinomyces wuliandei TaxID=2057743 RepID=UPI000FD7B7FC|nr:hypothetical protein [Actinomyces wuliandei]
MTTWNAGSGTGAIRALPQQARALRYTLRGTRVLCWHVRAAADLLDVSYVVCVVVDHVVLVVLPHS